LRITIKNRPVKDSHWWPGCHRPFFILYRMPVGIME